MPGIGAERAASGAAYNDGGSGWEAREKQQQQPSTSSSAAVPASSASVQAAAGTSGGAAVTGSGALRESKRSGAGDEPAGSRGGVGQGESVEDLRKGYNDMKKVRMVTWCAGAAY